MNTFGNSSPVTQIQGYVFESFRRMLYFGLYCLMRLFSSSRASASESTTEYWASAIFETRIRVFVVSLSGGTKYCATRLCRSFAFPT